ncbi:MAG: CotH kinase family protein [Ruminococcus sp.]|nr:CotH kinase family protein [Ruminococcus sp.]
MKKAISLFLALILLFGAFSVVPAVSAAQTDGELHIDRAYLSVGQALSVSCPEGVTLRYFVGEDEVDAAGFVLKPEYYENWITVRAYDGEELKAEDKVWFSKLPVLYINTDDRQPITSKEEYKTGGMFIQNNTETSAPMYDGAVKIKGRGNSTWNWDKKPYRIKLDKKTDLFGMGKNKNWVLLANYLDECFMRNDTAFRISEELGLVTMHSVWTDLVLNGEYVGNYQLCEQIRIDENRVNIFDWEGEAEDLASAVNKAEKKKGNILDKDALEDQLKSDLSWVTSGSFVFDGVTYTVADYYDAEDDLSGGYLFELSFEYDEVTKFMTADQLYIMLKSPEYLGTNAEMLQYVKTYWQDFENAYRADDGYADTAQGRKHYTELCDLDSMVGFWLVMEIMGNDDAVRKSRFAYKDQGELLKFGPVWDFDWGCGSFKTGTNAAGWKVSVSPHKQAFFKEFTDDPVFLAKATEKYWQIRPFLQTLVESGGILDTNIAYLSESGLADHQRWDRTGFWPNSRGFEKDCAVFKKFLTDRIRWLDQQFVTDDVLLKSAYTEYSAAPYTRSQNLSLSVLNAGDDTVTQHAPADGAVRLSRNAVLSVSSDDDATASVKIYVNGIFEEELPLVGGEAQTVIPNESLLTDGSKNVISLVGKDSSGKTTERNFATVILRESEDKALLGDADKDGEVGIIDATVIQRYLNDMPVKSFDYDPANVTGEGLDIIDATLIQRYEALMDISYPIGEAI